jgi:uncharacterized membrane protein
MFSLLKRGDQDEKSGRLDSLLTVFILGVSLGFFSIINTWDYPVYAALTVLAFILLKINLSKNGVLEHILGFFTHWVPPPSPLPQS